MKFNLLINTLPDNSSLNTLTCVDVPIPTDKLGCIANEILSPVSNSCAVLVVTSVFIFSTLHVTSSNCVSKKNVSSSQKEFKESKKWTSTPFISVLIPMVLIVLLTTNNVSGMLK